MLKEEIKKIYCLKKRKKKTQTNPNESSKVGLISWICNPWNIRHGLNREVQIQTNWRMK
jgi:hypothetical protein